MPWNDLRIRWQHSDHFLHSVNHAVDAAAAIHVDKGKAIDSEVVSHVHDIRFGEEDDGVAISVPRRKVQRANIFAIQVHRNVTVER